MRDGPPPTLLPTAMRDYASRCEEGGATGREERGYAWLTGPARGPCIRRVLAAREYMGLKGYRHGERAAR
jgi:hypothetical protein